MQTSDYLWALVFLQGAAHLFLLFRSWQQLDRMLTLARRAEGDTRRPRLPLAPHASEIIKPPPRPAGLSPTDGPIGVINEDALECHALHMNVPRIRDENSVSWAGRVLSAYDRDR